MDPIATTIGRNRGYTNEPMPADEWSDFRRAHIRTAAEGGNLILCEQVGESAYRDTAGKFITEDFQRLIWTPRSDEERARTLAELLKISASYQQEHVTVETADAVFSETGWTPPAK